MFDIFLKLIEEQLKNQFLTGGVVIVIFTAILASLRKVPSFLLFFIKRKLIVTVDIPDHDHAFFWIQKWLGEHEYTNKKSKLLTLSTKKIIKNNKENAGDPVELIYSPAPGYHFFKYKNKYILLYRSRTKGENVVGEVSYHESFILQSFSKNIIQELIKEAYNKALPPEEKKISIFTNYWADWIFTKSSQPRSLDTVILDQQIKNNIINDLDNFFSNESWYNNCGIPYRRGFLLTGKPGNGKTSLITALAGHFNRDIYILRLTKLSEEYFISVMAKLPENAFLVIEDFDCLFDKREQTQTQSNISFSTFLNEIDGISAKNGRVLFVTTNHPEKLDDALFRPGRLDKIIYIPNATEKSSMELFLRFFPNEHNMAEKFSKIVGNNIYSMAEIQEHLIQNLNNINQILDVKLTTSKNIINKINENLISNDKPN